VETQTRVERFSTGAQRSNDLVLDLPLRAVRRVLLAVAAALVAGSALAQVATHELNFEWTGAANLFDANQEANLPTLYSMLALCLAALLAAAIGASAREREGRSRWFALAGLFALAAIDEAAALHELANDPLRSLLDTVGLLSYPWVLPGAVLALAIALLFRPLVSRLPRPVRRLVAVGALLFVTGAVGIEMLENLLADTADGDQTLPGALVGTLSEACEMAGAVLIIEALLLYIALERRSLSLAIRPTGGAGTG
jgi:hypothetical protein